MKYFTLIVICLAAGCGGAATNPSTAQVASKVVPAGKLTKSFMGHWKSEAGDHLYFSAVDPATNRGSFIMAQAKRVDEPFYHEYEISEKQGSGTMLTLHFSSSGKSANKLHTVDEAGTTLTIESYPDYLDKPVSVNYSRVDDAVQP